MKLFHCLFLLAAVGWASSFPFFDTPSNEVDSSEFGGPPGQKGTTCKCGWTNKAGKRVAGGQDTGMHEYPYMASLITASRSQFCGGTILTPYHILTAAHCTKNYASGKRFMAVRVGDHDVTRLDETYYTQEIQVKKIVLHENYDDDLVRHDISLIVLSTPIQFNNLVGPACLPTQRTNLDNQYVKLVGWGKIHQNSTGSPILQDVNLRVVPLSVCATRYTSHILPNERTQICAHGTHKGACQGDSGGPLLWLDPEINRYVVRGIVSFGRICGSVNDPGVLTDVSAYLDWIQAKIAETSPSPVATCSKV